MSMFGRRNHWQESIRQDEERAVAREFHGQISGVTFDLRFAGFSPEDWSCPQFITDDSRFHFVGDLESTSPTLAGTVGEIEKIGMERALAEGRDVLFKGDIVRTVRVLVHRLDHDELTPDPDRDVAAAFLEVERGDRSREPLEMPLLFWPVGSLAPKRHATDTLSVFAQRLGRMSAGREDEATELAGQAARILGLKHRIQLAFWDLSPQVKGGLFDGVVGRFASMAPDVTDLVNEAVLYGYRQGRLEASVKMEPLARQKLAHVIQAHEAGRGNRDPVREKFAEEHKRSVPNPTVASATKAFLNLYPSEDASSVRRSFKRHFPLNKADPPD